MGLQTVSKEQKTSFSEEEALLNEPSTMNDNQSSDQMTRNQVDDLRLHKFECRSCGYIYDPKEGLSKYKIAKGTPFQEIDSHTFKCPVCRAGVDAYKDIGATFQPIEGFEENVKYGFGFNTLPPGQKNVLIFGGLAFAAACFLSLYSLH